MRMASGATVIKAELQVTDMDRHYYASHDLVLAQHPSETDQRLMARLVAFALHADERLAFGRGLGDEGEPALWLRDYGGNAAEIWWQNNAGALSRLRNLTVIDLDPDAVEAATALLARGMRLTAMIQDGELQLMDTERTVAIRPRVRMAPAGSMVDVDGR
jgi:uncharacterized protein YaeQ